jgi:translation initiation factor 3 subunit K
MNPEAISGLIETNRYNVEILPQLENFVQQQVEKQSYLLEANLAVLKFYQFHPEKANKAVIGNILLKALAALPSTDFLLCMYLVPERFVSVSQI